MENHVKSIHEYKQDIVQIGKMMYERRFIVAGDGNISVRLSDDAILATPTTLCKGLLTPDQIVKLDLNGQVLDGEYQPSSEIKMHLAAYRTRPDIAAVVHAHPPISTGFAVAGIPLDQLILAEMVVNFGAIPLAPYHSPSTEELAESVADKVKCYDAVLMANHGVMTIGPDVFTTYHRLEMVEQFATISLVAHVLGKMNTFSSQQLQDLIAIREKSGIAAQNPYRRQCPLPGQAGVSQSPAKDADAPPEAPEQPDMESLVNVITQTVLARLQQGS
jgi:L-fuculose-phosphate aldolase